MCALAACPTLGTTITLIVHTPTSNTRGVVITRKISYLPRHSTRKRGGEWGVDRGTFMKDMWESIWAHQWKVYV